MAGRGKHLPNLADAVLTGSGVERPFLCDVHPDSKASASVNVDKGVWVCYACGASGKVGTGSVSDKMRSLMAAMESRTPPRVYDPAWLDVFDAYGPSPYWAKRVGEVTAAKYRCGTHPWSNEPTYPVLSPSGEVWGVVRRTEGTPKYMYPSNVPIGSTLFGYVVGLYDTVVVAEGAGDVMAFSRAGPPERTLVVGTYGAGIKAPQAELIRKLKPSKVIMAYDNDDAGRTAARRPYDLGAAQIVVAEWPHGVKDPGEAPRDVLRKVMRK